MPFPRIAEKLNVSECTARRAYDYVHQKDIREAVERCETPSRGRYSHLGEDVYRKIRKMLRAGKKAAEIATKVGCGKTTVFRVREQMREEAGEQGAA